MLVPGLKSSKRYPPSPKELGETEVKSSKKNSTLLIIIFQSIHSYFIRIYNFSPTSIFLKFSDFEPRVILN